MQGVMEMEWVEVLRAECGRASQASVARRIGVSASMVNQVLKGVYRGDLERVRDLVEGAFMGAVVECPVLGELAVNECREHQRRPFAATNPQRVMLHRACREGCPHSHIPVEEGKR